MRGELSSKRLKEMWVTCSSISWIVSVHEQVTIVGFNPSHPQPRLYNILGGSRTSVKPRKSHSRVAEAMLPVEVGFTSSSIGLGSGSGRRESLTEKSSADFVCHVDYRCGSAFCLSVRYRRHQTLRRHYVVEIANGRAC